MLSQSCESSSEPAALFLQNYVCESLVPRDLAMVFFSISCDAASSSTSMPCFENSSASRVFTYPRVGKSMLWRLLGSQKHPPRDLSLPVVLPNGRLTAGNFLIVLLANFKASVILIFLPLPK
ncbi:hypothetical protein V6N13_081600 [Hibiscus sabdariffa]